jgi:hypothetical protein
MRYEKRWNNGYWKVFDTHRYTDKASVRTEKECDETVKRLNKKKD